MKKKEQKLVTLAVKKHAAPKTVKIQREPLVLHGLEELKKRIKALPVVIRTSPLPKPQAPFCAIGEMPNVFSQGYLIYMRSNMAKSLLGTSADTLFWRDVDLDVNIIQTVELIQDLIQIVESQGYQIIKQ